MSACRIALILILVAWPNNTVASLAGWQNKVGRASSQPLYFEKFWEPIATGIKEESSRKPSLELQKTALQYHLQPLGETEIAHLLLNRAGNARRRVIPAAIPWWITLALLGLALILLGWDLKRR